eukprot:m.40732 g.40732  ORF g.40732 m.40732 type:complete len:186 (-) comp12776_c0_seq1:1832-2389(-)
MDIVVLYPHVSSLLNDASLAHPIAISSLPTSRENLRAVLERLISSSVGEVPVTEIWERFERLDSLPCLMAGLFMFHRFAHCTITAIDDLLHACQLPEWYRHVTPAPLSRVCPLWKTLKPKLYFILLELKVTASASSCLRDELLGYSPSTTLVDPAVAHTTSPLDKEANFRGIALMTLAAKLRSCS